MRKKCSSQFVGWLVLVWLTYSLQCPSGHCATAAYSERIPLQVGEFKRFYRIHVPPVYDGKTPLPLVLVFHGRSELARDIAEITQFSELADRQGFIVVYPVGVREHWNDGRTAIPIFSAGNYDDVGFIAVLLQRLEAILAIDTNRIYATGMSNGGMFVQRLACELDGVFAAIGPVDGTLPFDIAPRCIPKQPVSVIEFHGTNDAYVHWQGGSVRAVGGKTLSVPKTVAHWRTLEHCAETPDIVYGPHKDPDEPQRVRRERYGSCRDGTEVVLYAIEGGGHTWPGGPDDPLLFAGEVNQDISATNLIWGFFSEHPKVSAVVTAASHPKPFPPPVSLMEGTENETPSKGVPLWKWPFRMVINIPLLLFGALSDGGEQAVKVASVDHVQPPLTIRSQ